jgi:glyoxylase-like metal-dependent hydrolase (beta-lactamase superfamily II)
MTKITEESPTNARSESTTEDWGHVHVTRRCCGAANCRNFAPEIFGEVATDGANGGPRRLAVLADSYEEGAFTGVIRQPRTRDEYLAVRAAAAGCGFGAIRLRKPATPLSADEKGSPWKQWPQKLEEDVWVIGQPSTRNHGALAYFIARPDGGVLIDLPKPSEELFRWLEAHGGVRWIFLTHRDHVQHHAEYAARFPGCRRVIGRADVNERQSSFAEATSTVEVKLANELVPRTLDGAPIPLEALADTELAVLPQPGHTPGSLCMLYRGRFLFTGDHLAYSRRFGHITAHRLQCWEDWERQTKSVSHLAAWAEAGALRFQWLLPGHGEWIRLDGDGGAAATAAELRRAVEWMGQQPPGNVPLLRWIPFVLTRAKPRGRFACLVMAIGGKGRDAWLLPRASRRYLPDFQPGVASVAHRRVYTFAAIGVAIVSLLAWFATAMH